MKHLYILTPSVARSDCHTNSIIPFANKIVDSNLFQNITWFINIDRPTNTKFKFESLEITENNFIEQTSKNISLKINKSKTPCFYKAFSNLFSSVKNDIDFLKLKDDDFCILWVEDDWKLTREVDFFRDLKLFFSKPELKFYTLYNHKINIGGNPQVIKGSLYNLYFKNMDISIDNKRDPEVIMRNEIFKPYVFDFWVFKGIGMEKHISESNNLTFKDKLIIANQLSKKYTDTFFISNGMYGNVVEDIGDLWREIRGFTKWTMIQKEHGINSNENYTYK